MISVVMPVYNEEKYIGNCVESLLLQDYPLEQMEWIFVDGISTDKTKKILEGYAEKYPYLIKIYDNPKRTVPYAMNIGIKNAKGKYIIRLDAHADYNKDYISKCVHYLDITDADNVGGIAITKSVGVIGHAIAKMCSSKFGVGNSKFRTNGESGYVDTVPFGAFRREVFERLGGYDERLTRNQDNEMNYRIRKNGGKIYLSREICFSYYCRDSISGIANMARANGKWNIITMKICPGTMGIRHIVPFVFVNSLFVLFVLGLIQPVCMWILFAEIITYFSLNVYFSLKSADSLIEFGLLLILFPIFHISYGIGSMIGVFSLYKYRR